MSSVHVVAGDHLSLGRKIRLLIRIWLLAARIQWALWRRPLPEVILDLSRPTGEAAQLSTGLLSRAVSRGLRVGRWHPRCLLRSLVLYRLLRSQGRPADLVIGLRRLSPTSDAHAWVELDGIDVGPLPGRGRHAELARFPRA